MPPRKRGRKEVEEYAKSFDKCTNEELRRELVQIGESPGPIDSSNRGIYVRMLARKKAKLDTLSSDGSETTPSISPLDPPFSARAPSLKAKGTPLLRTPLTSSKKKPPVAISPISPSLTASPKSVPSLHIKGFVAATFTPFTNEGEIDLSVIGKYTNFLCKQGVVGVFVNGSTGEGLSLTTEERNSLAEEWIRVAGKRLVVMIQVGSESLKSTCEMAMHAEQCGAAAIGLLPPTYFKPPTIESLLMYMEKVSEAAPNTPMLYYHIPIMSGITFSMEELCRKASLRVPTFRGFKFTSKMLMEYSQCVSLCNDANFTILYGSDDQVLASLTMGGYAAIGSTYNFQGQLYTRLFQAHTKGNMAGALLEQRRSQSVISLMIKYGSEFGNVSVLKAIMKMRGMDLGPPRLPLLPVSPQSFKVLEAELRSLGFHTWA